MAKSSPISEVRAFTLQVFTEADHYYLGTVVVTEHKDAESRRGLHDAQPEYGFKLIDQEGNIVADISAGYWPFIQQAIAAAAPIHSEHCAEDCQTEMTPIVVVPLEKR